MQRTIRHTARAIVLHDGMVLVMRAPGETFTHLPGGGIKRQEAPDVAVMREIREEVGKGLSSLAFVTMLESDWETQPIRENMSLYRATLFPMFAQIRTPATEQDLRTQWVPWYEIDRVRLVPKAVYPWVAKVASCFHWR